MPTLPEGVEERTRVVCALPLLSDAARPEYLSVLESFTTVLEYVERLQRYDIGVDGYTFSNSGAYFGRWRSERGGGCWVQDDIRLLVIDYRLPMSDGEMWVKLRELRIEIQHAYPAEEDVWVTATSIFRQVSSARPLNRNAEGAVS